MSSHKRRRVIAGNWKMYKTQAETRAFFSEFLPLVANTTDCDIVICPPFTSIAAAVQSSRGSNVAIGGQNLYWQSQGAFTGEISAGMLAEAGCRYVIVGHSERRQFFGDNDGAVAQKAKAAVADGLTPIVCVGESLADREEGRTQEVLSQQFLGGPASLTPEEFSRILLAYEPVWAIGTGRTATPEIAGAAHAFIRSCVHDQFSAEAAASVRILYGGSVKPDNIQGLKAQPDLDGALVGGASLEAKPFAAIVNGK
jgi:triosephosphate isomerase (TIM)